ncbi:MAG: 4-phosphoerythronate dehydrogenase [Gammaproteobacteria bacterium]
MIIVADRDIPRVGEAFADCGEVRLLPGREIDRGHLRDCRCLLVRTVTRIDRELLHDSPVEFVGSATIGTDHVDLEYLRAAGIDFSNAAGCNAEAVSEYVISGLFALSQCLDFDPLRMRAGIVGFGNVGKRVKHKFDALGIDCLLCDPPLAEAGATPQTFAELDTLVGECDLISLHTPLTRGGPHPTFHLFDGSRLRTLARDCLLINTARGSVVDNEALLELSRRRDDLRLFLDTWEHEPLISTELLRRVDLATPHIAGYSVEGRLRGTQAVLDAAAGHFGWTPGWQMSHCLPPGRHLHPAAGAGMLEFWQGLFREHFEITRDHEALVGGIDLDDEARARHFDSLRRVYPDRLEYPRFSVDPENAGDCAVALKELGFEVAP